ncbi:hypothetical protein FHS16_004094 [Paenibacillus endophyticus]|uniref:Peptide ABC transporter permease n=1 Tax=Paenibacillus endophyticus TaxID=1294268 RepID=A0A7W5CAB3_9BACL|nr:hypothetical protein [Paenibacillus endophyticus]MBB3154018.1 hypothetical protein [Paenibacillus endophyticus]
MKTRDVIYMIYNEKEQSVTSTGIAFADFATSLSQQLNHVLLLVSGYAGEDYHKGLQLEFVRKEHLNDLYQQNVYQYGNFCWIDFDQVEALDRLDAQEKAELLYLGHYKKALNGPFFSKLNNRFVYLAHDDGWYNKVFHKDKTDYLDAMCHIIPNKLKKYKRGLLPMGLDLANQLLSLAQEGILVDSYRSIKSRSSLEVPLYIIGEVMDFDDVHNDMERYKAKAGSVYWLVFHNKQWTIRSYQE